MRLHVLGDLHLEFGGIELPPTNADVVILAGDTHVGAKGCSWALQQFPTTPIVYLCGNHEFYHHTLGLIEDLRLQTKDTNLHMLENRAVEINGYRFLGCTLWTDFAITRDPKKAMMVAENLMNDFLLIKVKVGTAGGERRLRAKDTVKLHEESAAWLQAELSKGDPAKTIVVTHHAPSQRSEAYYHANSPLCGAFTSNLDDLITQSKVPLWIHGHTHFNVDYKLGVTRVLSNQRGYVQEISVGFNPSLTVEV
ncbi:MAG TPA: metallophosphoesterase [Candidatus Saccharimonadales bacterium]|nr:metallophosphoesterase [Candidatus Saccharimonadales bacterium]